MMRKALGMAVVVMAAVIFLAAAATPVWADPPATQPAKELKLDLGNGVSLKLVEIPAGKFTMGSPESEKRQAVEEAVAAGLSEVYATYVFKDEVQHEVTISKPFYMGITHVTVDQYAQFVKDTGQPHQSSTRGGDHPVVDVSWDDASAFCKWLSKKTGKTVVLPTEAQWEYACRAGSKTRFSFGDKDSDLGDYAWYSDNSGGMTHPVGQKKPNAWGLYDMHGNAWQWCSDSYGPYAAADKTDPTGPKEGSLRVLRGGSGCFNPRDCRSAYRHWGDPDGRHGDFGFRVAVVSAGVHLP